MQRWRTDHLVALLLCLAVAVAGPARPAVADAAAAAGQCARITSPFAGSPAGDGGVTLRIGCASEAGSLRSLAGNDNDLVAALDFDTSQRPEQWQTLINQQVTAVRADQVGGLSLGQSLVKQSRANGPGLYQAPDNGVDYNGSIQVVGSSIVIVVPAGDIAVSGFWDGVWKKLLVGLVNIAVTVGASAACLLLVALEAPVAAPLCAGFGAGLGAAVGEYLSARLDGVPIDWTVWGNMAGAAIAAAIGGALLGAAVTFLSDFGRQLVGSLQSTLKSIGSRIGTSIGDELKKVINEGAMDLIRRALERYMRGLQPSGASLRVMPLGDSITAGVGSTAMNGYRAPLQDRLRAAGVTFDFVGSQANGVSTADVQHEGHSGWRIDEIAARLPDWLSTYRPELVTLHLGTNDMIQNYQTSGAVERLGGVIDQIFAGNPGVTVVVSSLVPSRTAAIDARIQQFNQNLGGMIQRRIDNGRHLIYLSMAMVTTADIADDVHPNDAGYAKMARTFSLGIISAFHRGWLDDDIAMPETATCTPGDAGGGGPRRAGFADLNGDGKDDYVAVDPATGSMRTWLNVGADRDGDHWIGCGITASGTGTGVALDGRIVDLADIDGDGKDDYLAVDPATGNVHGWLNNGAHQSGDHWIDRGVIASGTGTGVGMGAREVRFADIDGDGRDDYLAVDPATGNVHGWLNNGAENGGDRWIDRGVIASGTGTGVGKGAREVQFADLNGDRRVEYLAVDPATGSTHAWLNNGAERGGDQWIDQGIVASGTNTGVSRTGRSVRFGDLNGDHLADYLALDETNGATHGWLNVGAHVSGDHWLYRGVIASGTNTGVGLIGAVPPSVKLGFATAAFADLNGDGRDDYLAVDGSGTVAAWLNDGADQGGNHWASRGIIASGIGTGVAPDGRVVRWADLDGDGRDDYVAVDPGTGLAQGWINNGADTTGDHWIDRGIIASGTGTGVGNGVQVYFADMDGDGRDDYLAVDQSSGSAHLWLNVGADRAGDRWVDQGVIASGTGTGVRTGGPQVAFADLDGDGKDDYLAVDPATGAAHAWLNRGAHTTGDHWLDGGVVASGTNTGVATSGRRAYLADLNTDRRADYLAVDPNNGDIRGWLNNGAVTVGDHWIGLGTIATGNGRNGGAGN